MFFQNIDCDSTILPFLSRFVGKERVTKEDLYPLVDEFQNTPITDILWNVSGQLCFTDSAVWGTYRDKYLQREEDGHPVDYRDYYEGLYHVSARLGLDPFGTWMERCREIGIRPHLSIRMNDCHDPAAETSPLREDFFYEARRRGMMNGTRYGHYRNTLNYRFPEIRERFLALIEEQLLRYDVEGIELDFMRETCGQGQGHVRFHHDGLYAPSKGDGGQHCRRARQENSNHRPPGKRS